MSECSKRTNLFTFMFQYLIIYKLRTDEHPCDKGTEILLNACCKLNTICTTIPLYTNPVTIKPLDQGESTGKLLPICNTWHLY